MEQVQNLLALLAAQSPLRCRTNSSDSREGSGSLPPPVECRSRSDRRPASRSPGRALRPARSAGLVAAAGLVQTDAKNLRDFFCTSMILVAWRSLPWRRSFSRSSCCLRHLLRCDSYNPSHPPVSQRMLAERALPARAVSGSPTRAVGSLWTSDAGGIDSRTRINHYRKQLKSASRE